MVHYLLRIVLFCAIKVYCEDYNEINNSLSLDADDNPDNNEVFDSAEYLDARDDELERNNTEFNKSKELDFSSEDISPLKENKEDNFQPPTTKKTTLITESGNDAHTDFNVTANATVVRKCSASKRESEEQNDSSEETECNNKTSLNLPFSVSIQRKGAHYATGALVNNRTVLTAAADFYNVRETIKLFKARLGSVDCKKGGVLLNIKSIYIHPQFELGNPAFDVAVIKLSKPVVLTEFIKPIPLSNVTQKLISAKFMTSYWARLIVNGKPLPKTAKEHTKHHSMRVSTQRLIPWDLCFSMMDNTDVELDQNSLCLKPIYTHHSKCVPDPGAPVIAEDVLWGITSGWTSELCQAIQSPTVITRIAMKPIRKWLDKLLWL